MASINDVFNELQAVNTNLGVLHADDIAETNATNQVRASVDQLDNDVKAGFSASINMLITLAKIDIEAVKLLFHLAQQAETMICTLEHISKNTCGLLTQSTIQTQLQTRVAENTDLLRAIAEAAHPDAVLAYEKAAKLRAEIHRCCPPPVQPPACSYEPCARARPVGMPDLPRLPDQQKPPG